MMKLSKEELKQKIVELIPDEDLQITLLEDIEDSFDTEETDTSEYDELKAKYDDLKSKYKERFLKGKETEETEEKEEEKKEIDEPEEEEKVEEKDIFKTVDEEKEE